MCGRFTLTAEGKKLAEAFAGYKFTAAHRQRFNIAPTQDVEVILNDGAGEIVLARWGLVPRWNKEPGGGSGVINARSESVADKPLFRGPFRRQRCLVLADGFYEWKAVPRQRLKLPYHIRLRSAEPFAFAGLWDRWRAADGSDVLTCAILTTEPNDLMRQIHNRMPVILPPDVYPEWLASGEVSPDALCPLLKPFPSAAMEARVVSPRVNNPRFDDPSCLDPQATQADFGW
jgi:putative SOS response-associated peptidase YedK